MGFKTTILAAAATVGLALGAQAAPITAGSKIDLTGFVQATGAVTLNQATSLDFTGNNNVASVGTAGPIDSFGNGSGVFAGFNCTGGSCGSIKDIASLATGSQTISNFVSLSGGNLGSAINFTLNAITDIGRGNPNFLTFTATGVINYDGFDATPGTFLFSAQGNTITSFSATTLSAGPSSVTEPASLAILGVSLAAFGLVRRRRG